jgi:hypothetical protein
MTIFGGGYSQVIRASGGGFIGVGSAAPSKTNPMNATIFNNRTKTATAVLGSREFVPQPQSLSQYQLQQQYWLHQ